MGLFKEAISEYKEVLRLKPDDPDALNNLRMVKYKILEMDKTVND